MTFSEEVIRLLKHPPKLLYDADIKARMRTPGRSSPSWTKEEQQILHDLLQSDKTVDEMVMVGTQKLGKRNKESVRRMLYQVRKNGIVVKSTKKTWSIEEDKRLLDLKSQKLSVAKISKLMKRSKNSVQQRFFWLSNQ